MSTIASIAAFLDQLAPARLAEEWDNVGLLVGHRGNDVRKVMTCLTITPCTAAEAIEMGVQLIVTHHPLPFHPLKRLTTDTTAGHLLLDLISAHIAVYSAHTAFDSAWQGVNHRLAEGIGLRGISALTPHPEGQGAGRWGWFAEAVTLQGLADRVKRFLAIERLQTVGVPEHPVHTLAIGCGAAGEFLDAARENHCDAMVLGEARFHTCLEAEAAGIGLVLPGHFASERFAMVCLAKTIAEQFANLEVWASRTERDPVRWG